jgi:predicted O-methyltransferase YrrM
MLQHIRHLLTSTQYNWRTLRDGGRAPLLVRAWFRNEVAYWRRARRLSTVLGTERRVVEDLLSESEGVVRYCAERSRPYNSLLPGLLNPNYGPVLYAVVRLLRPRVVVETGVGSGVSSTFFLNAMERNGVGMLYSIDLPLPGEHLLPERKETGWIVPDTLRERWRLVLGDARQELPALLERLGMVDGFFHDSDHSYRHMTWEFDLAYPHVHPGGVLLSDDITSNDAWSDFVSRLPGRSARINRTGLHRKPDGRP